MPSIWWTRRAFGLHATIVAVFPGFLALGWWQLHRALSGNKLSWAYTFEWPFFAIYAVVLWWKLVHEQPGLDDDSRPRRTSTQRSERAKATAAREDEERAAYNAYLASLQTKDREETR